MRARETWLRFGWWACVLAGTGALRGELRWSETTIERPARAGDEVIEAVFRFWNTGSRPATLGPVESSCGCTTATAAKETYAPGETGEVRVRFDLRQRTGRQEKTLLVRTVEEPTVTVTLTLRVAIQELLTVTPRLLVWAVGEAARPKPAALQLEPGVRVTLSAPEGDADAFVFTLGEPGPNGTRELLIAPRSTAAWKTQKVDLLAIDARGARTSVTVHACVR